jgi:hypothetical protein
MGDVVDVVDVLGAVVDGEMGTVVVVLCGTVDVGVAVQGFVVAVGPTPPPGVDVVGAGVEVVEVTAAGVDVVGAGVEVVEVTAAGVEVVGAGAEVVEVTGAGVEVEGAGAEVVEVVGAGVEVVGAGVEVVVVMGTIAWLVKVTSVTPGPIVTLTRPAARFAEPARRSSGSTEILETPTPGTEVSAIETGVPAGKLPATEQRPPGAGPAGTFMARLPTMKTKLVPIVTPGPATLQSLTSPVSNELVKVTIVWVETPPSATATVAV